MVETRRRGFRDDQPTWRGKRTAGGSTHLSSLTGGRSHASRQMTLWRKPEAAAERVIVGGTEPLSEQMKQIMKKPTDFARWWHGTSID